MRLLLGQAFGVGQPGGDLPVMFEILEVRRRGEDRHVLAPSLGGRADIDQLHAVALARQLLPISDELRVVRNLIIVADIESEEVLGSGDVRGGLRPEAGSGEDSRDEMNRAAAGRSRGHWESVLRCAKHAKRGAVVTSNLCSTAGFAAVFVINPIRAHKNDGIYLGVFRGDPVQDITNSLRSLSEEKIS